MNPPTTQILILDDEFSLRDALADALEDLGFPVVTADAAEDALRLLNRTSPDLAIVDLRLPGMDGQEFILRANRLDPHLGFVIMTGSLGSPLDDRLRALGIDDDTLLRKPLGDISVLLTALRTAHDRAARRA